MKSNKYAGLNFRNTGIPSSVQDTNRGGTKPTAQPASVKFVFLQMLLFLCKKSIFYNTNIRVALYLACLFLISLISDFLPVPRMYLSRSDNVFNKFFVKVGWFWTLLLTVPFVVMTSYTICCGNKSRIVKGHLTRLAIATFFWYSWTSFFNYVEYTYGRCNVRSFTTKPTCLKSGNFWNGFDLSGHCFILIYSSLILIEEARAIIGWESIKDHIRDEEYARKMNDQTLRSNPLKSLQQSELDILVQCYEKFTPYIRGIFVGMTCLQILWDVMLFCTLLYYHIMVEKFVSGVLAILTWYITYEVWYKMPKYFPLAAGTGIFKYNKEKVPEEKKPGLRRKASLINKTPPE